MLHDPPNPRTCNLNPKSYPVDLNPQILPTLGPKLINDTTLSPKLKLSNPTSIPISGKSGAVFSAENSLVWLVPWCRLQTKSVGSFNTIIHTWFHIVSLPRLGLLEPVLAHDGEHFCLPRVCSPEHSTPAPKK